MFPVLSEAEVSRLRRYGTARRYARGERLFETGKVAPGMIVIVAGHVRMTSGDGHGHDVPIVEHGAGSFMGELGQMSGKPAFVDGVAIEDIDAILIPSDKIRAVLHAYLATSKSS